MEKIEKQRKENDKIDADKSIKTCESDDVDINFDCNIRPPLRSCSSSSSCSDWKKSSVPVDSSSLVEEEETYKKIMQPLQYGETEHLSGYHYMQHLTTNNMGSALKTRIKRLVST